MSPFGGVDVSVGKRPGLPFFVWEGLFVEWANGVADGEGNIGIVDVVKGAGERRKD